MRSDYGANWPRHFSFSKPCAKSRSELVGTKLARSESDSFPFRRLFGTSLPLRLGHMRKNQIKPKTNFARFDPIADTAKKPRDIARGLALARSEFSDHLANL